MRKVRKDCASRPEPGPFREWSCSQAYYLPGDAGPGPCPCECHTGETPLEIAARIRDGRLGLGEGIDAIKAYGDRRGEEERAKALADALVIVENSPTARWNKIHIAAKIRSLAAAPSGDAKGTK